MSRNEEEGNVSMHKTENKIETYPIITSPTNYQKGMI